MEICPKVGAFESGIFFSVGSLLMGRCSLGAVSPYRPFHGGQRPASGRS